MNTLLLHCRPGFEGEVCAELSEHAARLGVAGYAKGKASSACAEFVCSAAGATQKLMGVPFSSLIFPRQWARGDFVQLPETDRISVIPNGHEHALRWTPRHSDATRKAAGADTIVVIGSPAPHKKRLAQAPTMAGRIAHRPCSETDSGTTTASEATPISSTGTSRPIRSEAPRTALAAACTTRPTSARGGTVFTPQPDAACPP